MIQLQGCHCGDRRRIGPHRRRIAVVLLDGQSITVQSQAGGTSMMMLVQRNDTIGSAGQLDRRRVGSVSIQQRRGSS